MSDSPKLKILLAGDDALRREGLAALLPGMGDFEVAASVADGAAAMDAIRRLRPDIAIVDLNIPGLHGIELLRRVQAEALGTRILIVASTESDEMVAEVMRAGEQDTC